MKKRKISVEDKRLDIDLWMILLITLGVFFCYTIKGNQIMEFVKDDSISIIPRLLLNAAIQFGVAGLGTTIVCIWRKEKFTSFGLKLKNLFKAILSTIVCFIPSIFCTFLAGQFNGYRPFSILITDNITASGLPFSVIGMVLIIIVWGFFEGFNLCCHLR